MAKVKITLMRSLISRPETQRATVRSLGLRKLNSSVEREMNDALKGQIHKVEHLVKVENI